MVHPQIIRFTHVHVFVFLRGLSKTAELLCLLVTIRPHDEVFELRDLQHDISEGRHWRRRLRHLRVSTTVYRVFKHTLITRNSCRSIGDELLATSVNDPEIQAEKCLKFCVGKLGLRIFFLDAIASQAVQVWSSHQAGKDSEASHQNFQRTDWCTSRMIGIQFINNESTLNPSSSTLWMQIRRPTLFMLSWHTMWSYEHCNQSTFFHRWICPKQLAMSCSLVKLTQFHQTARHCKSLWTNSRRWKNDTWPSDDRRTSSAAANFTRPKQSKTFSYLVTPQLFWFCKLVLHIMMWFTNNINNPNYPMRQSTVFFSATQTDPQDSDITSLVYTLKSLPTQNQKPLQIKKPGK